jgi:Fe-S oxidoreductase
MAPRLPVLESRADATRACTFCPKLCRPACPVATVTANDALSAWGIMGALHPIAAGAKSADAATLAAAYACTGCEHCESHCELSVDVAATALEARSVAHTLGLAPEAVRSFVNELPAREERVRVLAERIGAVDPAPTGVVLFAGCTLVATAPSHVAAAQRAIERLVGPVSLVADLCCGAPWLDAGDIDGFRARAEALSDRVRRASTVIALDPGCVHVMRVRAPQFGMHARSMEWLEQFFLQRIERLPQSALASMGSFAVHDSCRAGRGLRSFDAPRAVIERLTGVCPIELAMNRERSQCSGGGGLLPVTAPTTADAITDELALLVRDSGADHVLVGCPTTKQRLTRVGISAFTLSDLFCELGRGEA